MTTIVEAPREPSHDDLEALIEEARRRARRRRLLVGGAIAGSLLLAGLVTGLVLAFTGGSGTAVPKGFHLVRARGPVQHAFIENVVPPPAQTLDLATGNARPTRGSSEVWWDPRSGFVRTLYRYDGRVGADWVEQQCQVIGHGKRFCPAPEPFDLKMRGLGWPPRKHFARRAGTGTFRGHRVVWIEGLVQPGQGKPPYRAGDQVAYDAVTHRPLALRSIARNAPVAFRGKVFSLRALKQLPNLEAKRFSFVVPDGGVGFNPPNPVVVVTGQRLPAARAALGRTPLWLGRSFHGHRLVSVVVGREGAAGQNRLGMPLKPFGFARFARFDYGSFAIKEFGRDRPWWSLSDPPAGKAVFSRGQVTLARDGVQADITPTGAKFSIDRATALALAKALRPVDG